MNWKRLVEFALLGSNDLEQYAILLVRVSLGLFFAISGANKLFVTGGAKAIYRNAHVKAKRPVPPPDGLFRVKRRVRLRILADRGVSFEPEACVDFIDRHDCRCLDQRGFHHA